MAAELAEPVLSLVEGLKQSSPNCRLALRLGHAKGAESRTMGIRQSAKLSTKYLTPFFQPMGSIAYSMALVAAGKADGTINVDPLHEWDVVAGWLLVQEGRGTVTDYKGVPISYNQAEPLVHGILAARCGTQQPFEALISKGIKKRGPSP